ncbi:MAG: hypothetical protein RLY76_50 [Actinomycetota bacterium]|jgi:hypothetical protein
MIRYLGLGFLASTLASIYMFLRAMANGFSTDIALCMTRGGESCFATSNPVWTASTLLWLAPLILIFSVLGAVSIGIFGDTGIGWGAGLFFVAIIFYLALNNEIKDKTGWAAPFIKLLLN